jgi:hypothetical protein
MTGPEARHGGAQAEASGPWDYTFGVQAAPEADRALYVLLAGHWMADRITITFRPAQFAGFKKGLEKSGVELLGVTRVPHQDPEVVR